MHEVVLNHDDFIKKVSNDLHVRSFLIIEIPTCPVRFCLSKHYSFWSITNSFRSPFVIPTPDNQHLSFSSFFGPTSTYVSTFWAPGNFCIFRKLLYSDPLISYDLLFFSAEGHFRHNYRCVLFRQHLVKNTAYREKSFLHIHYTESSSLCQ